MRPRLPTSTGRKGRETRAARARRFANSNHRGSPRELSSEGRPEARKRQVEEGRCSTSEVRPRGMLVMDSVPARLDLCRRLCAGCLPVGSLGEVCPYAKVSRTQYPPRHLPMYLHPYLRASLGTTPHPGARPEVLQQQESVQRPQQHWRDCTCNRSPNGTIVKGSSPAHRPYSILTRPWFHLNLISWRPFIPYTNRRHLLSINGSSCLVK
jgi:hypothetical protein